MIRRPSSAGPCKYLNNYDKKIMLNFCKGKKGKNASPEYTCKIYSYGLTNR